MARLREPTPSGKDEVGGKQLPESSGSNFSGSSAGAGNPVAAHDPFNGLADEARWLLWRRESDLRTGKITKAPRQKDGTYASSTDPGTWTTRSELADAHGFDGIGIVLGGGLSGTDLDACLSPNGELEPWAEEIVRRLNTYCEVSPSGGGVKLLYLGPKGKSAEVSWGDPVTMPNGDRKRREIAHYTGERYFTITGKTYGKARPVRKLAEAEIAWLRSRIEAVRSIERLPRWLADLIRDGAEVGQRSNQFQRVIDKLTKLGKTVDQIEAILSFYPDGIAQKYASEDRLRAEIERSASKVESDDVSPVFAGPDTARATLEELNGEPYEPPDVIEGLIPRDAGAMNAPGEMGKTTLVIYMAVHIILGRRLFGHPIVQPGAVLFVTAEDSRETLMGRLNAICKGLRLNDEELTEVVAGFYVEDVSAKAVRLMAVEDKKLQRTSYVGELIDQYRDQRLSLVVLDPLSLLGPGEETGNDGMGEMLRTCRHVSRELVAAVINLHHVGKEVSRSQISDQYAGRGASAIADNGRFVFQLMFVNSRTFKVRDQEWRVPDDISDPLLVDPGVLILVQHKHSYRKKRLAPIVLFRDGFQYTMYDGKRDGKELDVRSIEDKRAADREAVVDYIAKGLRETPQQYNWLARLEDVSKDIRVGMRRDDVREAVTRLKEKGLLFELRLPEESGLRQGGRQNYLAVRLLGHPELTPAAPLPNTHDDEPPND